jgi:antitoxin VapB
VGISIKHDEYERLIRQLATERGMSLTEAVGLAVRRELERDAETLRRERVMDGIRRAQAIYAASPVLDDRTPDEIIGYNEYGVPA